MALNDKQEAFCREYLIDYNRTQAAIRAGYDAENARSVGSRQSTDVDICRRIAELKREHFDRLEMDAEWTLRELEANHRRAVEKGDVSASTAALAHIARIRGENNDKLHINLFEGMSDAELRAIIDED